MFGANTEQIQFYMGEYVNLITTQDETEANCGELRQILRNLGGYNLGYAIRMPGSKCPIESQKQILLAAHSGTNFSRDLVINMTGVSIPIYHGKGKFFEIAIDAYPEVLFVTKTPTMEIDSPLICAIDKRNLALVNTVLSNIHFLDHEFNKATEHLAYIRHCISYASQAHPTEMGVLQLLNSVLTIRMPLIAAMGQDNNFKALPLTNTRQFCLSSTFTDHQTSHPKEHRVIVKDCIKCADKLLRNISTAASELLKASLNC